MKTKNIMKMVAAMVIAVALTNGCCTSQRRVHASTTPLPAPQPGPGPAEEPARGDARPTGGSGSGGGGGEVVAGGELVVPLCEEKVTVNKRDADVTVTVRKVVKTESVNVPLELRRETVIVERLPGGPGGADECRGDFGEKQFTIQLKREEPVVDKKVVSAGKVVVKKRSGTITKQVSEVSRREEVVIENEPKEP